MPQVLRAKGATPWQELDRVTGVDTSPGAILREFGDKGDGR
jgi:hypothetical protein